MRDLIYIAIVVLTIILSIASVVVVLSSQPQAQTQLHNAYWPYSVEVSIKDR